jgi:hypothetical protein
MIKKSIFSLLMIAFVVGSIQTTNAQEKPASYEMWESMMITPDNAKLKLLGDALRKHNQTYHKQAPYTAFVYNIVTGPNTGKLIWEMGPVTFTQLDKRPASSAHDDEWRDLVMPYVKSMTHGEYWRADDKLNNTSMLTGDASVYPLLFVRYNEVAKDQGHNVNRLFKQISETVKAMEGVNPWGVYYNEFRQGYNIGRHIATVSFYKNWAELDKEDTFKKTFEKLYGENSWDEFVQSMGDTFSNSWDEIWEYNPKLSGK